MDIILYNGFFAVVGAYLFVQMARGIAPGVVRIVGTAAFVWRLALTTGTGSIFGWLVARSGYDAAIMAPLFIIMSFSFGLAFFILVLGSTFPLTGRFLGKNLIKRLGRLLGVFAVAVLYFTAVRHLSNYYAAEHGEFERFILFGDTMFTPLFWIGQVLIGGVVPAAILLRHAEKTSKGQVIFAAVLIILGGFAHLYGIIIGGQAFPLEMFPAYEVTSTFMDGQVNSYTPSIYEWALGLGGVALAVMIAGIGVVALRILPMSLSDRNIDPTELDF